MKVTFLGTGTSQGIPVIGSHHPVCKSEDVKDKRLRSSIIVETENCNIIIDCSPDFRQQMLLHGPNQIDGLLFTHEHADHTMGLDDIRPYYFRQGAIPIFAHKRVLTSLRNRFDYIFNETHKYPGAPGVLAHEIYVNKNFCIQETTVIPINCYHGALQVFGFRINRFAYLTDVKTIASTEIQKLDDLDVLVVNALRIEAHHSHFNLEEALNFITLVKPKRAYLTHISHLLGFHEEVLKTLPNNITLAHDNLTITL
jgi:phosphoribosyl 1,2-cyclic phosphate phosphodiesterase